MSEAKPDHEVIIKWWKELVDDDHKGQRAKLKRCKTWEEIIMNPDQIRLKQKTGNTVQGIEFIASLLAHIKNEPDKAISSKMLAEQMVIPVQGTNRPTISQIRFRRLLKCETREELHDQLLRVIKIFDNKSSVINIPDLIDSIHYWGANQKRRWAEEYYGNLKDD